MTSPVTVSISIKQITGTALPRARVTFERTAADIDGAIIAPAATTVTCEADGTGSASLMPNATGSQGTQYRVTIVNEQGELQFSGLATVPASNCNLHSVLNLTAPASVDDAQQAARDAQAYAAQAAVDLAAHVDDAAGAHAASAISLAAIGGMTATTVQEAVEELANVSGVSTNLAATLSATNIVVTSDTGTDATLPAADDTNAGLMVPAQVVKVANTSGTNTGDETADSVGALISGAADKDTPADGDTLGLSDSAASNILKKLTWANLKAKLRAWLHAYFDSAATNALDFRNGPVQRWAPAVGAQTLTITNLPAAGEAWQMLIEGVNLGASTITWPTIQWQKPDGTFTTSISTYLTAAGITLQTSGIDWVFLWGRAGDTTIYGKVSR